MHVGGETEMILESNLLFRRALLRLTPVALVALGFALLGDGAVSRVVLGWLPFVPLSLLIAVYAFRMFTPARLTLTPTHLVLETPLLPKRVVAWDDIESFEVKPRGRTAALRDLTFVTYRKGSRAAAADVLNTAMQRGDPLRAAALPANDLGGPWRMSSEDLVARLNTWRERARGAGEGQDAA
ncbi:MAG TPA: hypothetical protein VG939_07985 [Caulobacteraceae bacterium]|nr:hypothetical protein [Caulobacteraceae bacterium]